MSASIENISPSPIVLPAPGEAQVWLDFDGTITQQDVLDEVIKRFSVNDSWKLVEQRWQSGLIGSRQCLQEQFALVRAEQRELDELLTTIGVDRGLRPLLQLLADFNVPCAIVSDGVEQFIRPILARASVNGMTIRCNNVIAGAGTLEFQCPHFCSDCTSAAAHCKCNSMKLLGEQNRQSIYVGDGRSDLCPARKASVVFAKGVLANCLANEGIPFVRYQSLLDVAAALSAAWRTPTRGS